MPERRGRWEWPKGGLHLGAEGQAKAGSQRSEGRSSSQGQQGPHKEGLGWGSPSREEGSTGAGQGLGGMRQGPSDFSLVPHPAALLSVALAAPQDSPLPKCRAHTQFLAGMMPAWRAMGSWGRPAAASEHLETQNGLEAPPMCSSLGASQPTPNASKWFQAPG